MKKTGNSEKKDLNLYSPTLITTYSERAIDFINSIQRFLYVLIPMLIIFAIVILFDTTAMKNYVRLLSDDIFDLLAVIFTFIIIGTVFYILKIIIKIRKRLGNWAYLFEKNSIHTSLSMSMSKIDYTEILNAIVDSIHEIGAPLKRYTLNDSMSIKRFTNQSLSEDLVFDILIDNSRIDSDKDEHNFFKNKLNEYGSIVVKIMHEPVIIDIDIVESFIKSILEYVKITHGYVGLALLIGNEVSSEAMDFVANFSNKSIGYLIVIDKPVIMDSIQ